MNQYQIKVNCPLKSEQVQKHAFELGYKWGGYGKTVMYTTQPFLFLHSDGEVYHGTIWGNDLPEISVEDFLKIPVEEPICTYFCKRIDDFCEDCTRTNVKVYCGKCKWFQTPTIKYGYLEETRQVVRCSHKSNTIKVSTWKDETEGFKDRPETINANNNCKNFEEI